uniref:Putative ixodes 10 kDa peptide protein n=1 Tax=Ixodes ricinus TaxID=34613 RepID=A0A0K8RIQ8_IXORI
MYRNISNMMLVLFAVVLILPAFQGEGFLFVVDKCYLALLQSGKTYCELLGHDKFDGLIFGTCELVCGGPKVPLPKKACPNRSLQNPCTEDELHHLQKWAKTLETKKEKVKEKWC